VIIKRPWTTQPQVPVGVDASGPYGQKLIFLFNGAVNGGWDAVKRARPIDGTYKSTPGGALFDATNALDFGTWPSVEGLTSVTVFAEFTYVYGAGEAYGGLFGKTYADAGGSPYGTWWFEISPTLATITWSAGTSGGLRQISTGSYFLQVNTRYRIVGTWSNSSGSNTFLFSIAPVNGAVTTISGGAPGSETLVTGSSPSNGVLVGGRNSTTTDGGSNRSAGNVYKAGVLGMSMSSAEQAAFLNSNWNQLFAPLPRRIWAPSAGGAVTHASSGDLSAQSAVVAGTAAHIALHPSSGALSAQSATIAGTSARFGLRPTSGALSAQSATVAGTAARVGLRPTSGALSAQNATVAGTAARVGLRPTSGALSAQSATVAGTAAHIGLHPSSGALSAQSAVIAGSAENIPVGAVSHPSTGALTAQSATVDGTAARVANHQSSGALSAQDATVTGTAAHVGIHATSGALVADSATVSGVAQNGTAVASVPSTGAGRPRKTRKRKVIVTIDGEDFTVSSEAEAVELLESAKAEAEKKAEEVTTKAVAATNRPKRKILADVRKALTTPEIAVSKAVQPAADKIQSEIAKIYADALRAVEIATLMRRQADEQDDEDILLMLL
jgi:hypothetical protein